MIQVSEGRTDKSIPEVDLSQAVKIGRLSDGLIRYTFDLSSNQPHVFSNLIVIEHPEHEPMSYITEYHPDRDWLIEKAGNWKAIDYTGYVLTKALDGQVLTVSEYEHGEGDIFKYDPKVEEAGRTACDPLFGWSPGDFTGWVDVGNGSWSNFNTGTSSFSSGDPSGGSWTIIIIKTTQPDDDFSGDGENPSGGGSDPWVTRTSCGGGYDPNAILCNGTGNCSQVTAVTSVFCEDECDEEELCDQNPLTTWAAGECECTFGKGENGECVSEAEAWEEEIENEQDLEKKRKLQLQYLEKFGGIEGKEFKAIMENLLETSGLTVGDVSEINTLVNSMYLNLKAQYMMAIFSPDNVGTILMLALSGNTSSLLRSSFFKAFTRYGAYEGLAGMIGSKTWMVGSVSVTFRGYTTHGTISYGISKGFTPQFIRSALANGTPRIVNHSRWGNQLFIEYQGKAIIIDIVGGSNHGKIITFLTNP